MYTKQSFNTVIIIGLIAVRTCWAAAGPVAVPLQGIQPNGDPALSVQGSVVKFANPQASLGRAFEEFHFETVLDCMTEVMGGIRDFSAKAYPNRPPVVLSGNPAGGMHIPRWVEVAAPFDYFNIECDVVRLHQNRALAHFLSTAALAESVDTTLLVMPNAMSNKRWNTQENPLAYAGATGLSYALGGHMHIPWCLYDGSQFTRFYGSLDGHQPIFSLIHDRADWFDGYVPALWHVLEVPYGEGGVQNLPVLESQVLELFQAGVPSVLRLKGENAPVPSERISAPPYIRSTFDAGKKAHIPESPFQTGDAYRSAFLPPIPRVHHDASTAPMVLHLIRQFNAPSSAPASGQFTVKKSFLQGIQVTNVEVAAPEWPDVVKPSVRWEINSEGDLKIEVENIPAWALLRVHSAVPVKLPSVKRAALRQAMVESEIPIMRMIRFSNTWTRPQWVDDALATKADPLDGYHVTRISWSYDHSLKTLEHARAHGMAFHGSDAFLHTYMDSDGIPPQEGIATFTPDWPGWARYPNGLPMHIRPDFIPPRYGASFASPDYRTAMIERGKDWVEKGAAGIQFDDICGMVNRVWKYGGDFSDAFFVGFRSYLAEQRFDGVAANTPLDVLRERVMAEMEYKPAHEQCPDGAVIVHKTGISYPGLVWVAPSSPFAAAEGPVTAEVEFRMTEGDMTGVELLLMDGERTVYLSRIPLTDILSDGAPEGEWMRLRIRHDLKAQTTRFAVGKDGKWSEARPFDMPLPAKAKSLSLVVMTNPRYCGIEVRNMTLNLD